MPSGEYARIVRDLGQFGESIVISCTKQGVKFTSTGDIGTGNIKLAQTTSVDDDDKKVEIDLQEPVTLTFAAK
jgi:proliferating cell nuclear antigen